MIVSGLQRHLLGVASVSPALGSCCLDLTLTRRDASVNADFSGQVLGPALVSCV